MVSDGKGNYDYLMFSDIDVNSPAVRTELARWGKWFLKTTIVNPYEWALFHVNDGAVSVWVFKN